MSRQLRQRAVALDRSKRNLRPESKDQHNKIATRYRVLHSSLSVSGNHV